MLKSSLPLVERSPMTFLPATTLCQGRTKESPGARQAPPVDQAPLTSLYLWVLERPNLSEKPG